jgi:signal transduction histidine kinase
VSLRLRTLQWTYGAIALGVGLPWLLTATQFDARALALVFGLAMLACAALAPAWKLQATTHLGLSVALLPSAWSQAQPSGPAVALTFGSALGIALAPWLARDVVTGKPTRLDALALTAGGTGIAIGVLLAARPDLAHLSNNTAWLGPYLPTFAVLFALGSLALLATQFHPRTRTLLRVEACFAGASGWLAWSLLRLVPDQLWTGALSYAAIGVAVAWLPWLGPMLDRADPHSLRTRLAFGMALATSAPLVAGLALISRAAGLPWTDWQLGALLAWLLLVSILSWVVAGRLVRPLRTLAAARTTTLQAITAALAPTLTSHAVAAAVIEHALPAVGASAATLLLRTADGLSLERLVETGYTEEVSGRYQRYPMTTSVPAASVVMSGKPLWIESASAVAADFSYYAANPTGHAAAAILPLASDDGADGVLILAFDQERSFGADERTFMLAIAGQCAVALQRARLLRAEQESRAEAESALRMRDVFLRSLAHDLKTPLASLAWHTQLLRRRAREGRLPAAALEDGLLAIEATTSEAAAAIDELHDLARLGSGDTLELHLEPVDLVALVQGEVGAHNATGGAHARLHSQLATIQVKVDAPRIRRVIANLLDNASKYSPSASEVRVTVGRDGTGWATLQVQDDGRGIPAADLPHIFEPYRRGENAGGVPGEGLGLASVQRLVELHGGEVSATSVEGRGSTFTVRLPHSHTGEDEP